jgi:hypothetical protein
MMAVAPSFGYQPQQVKPASAPHLAPLAIHPRHMQQLGQLPPGPVWNPWIGYWDQQSIANSFSTMTLNEPAITDWVIDSGASNHTTPDSGNVYLSRPPNFGMPSSTIVGNGSVLQVTYVGDTVLIGPFYLNNILVAPDIIQNFLSIHKFTTNNSCSMEFDPFDLSMKDLAMQNMIIRSNSFGLVYTLRLSTQISTPQVLTDVASTFT